MARKRSFLEEAQEMNDLLIEMERGLHQIPGRLDLEASKELWNISVNVWMRMDIEYKVFP